MRYSILLDRNEKVKDIEAQEQARFIKSILESLEVPFEFDSEGPLSIDDKLQLKKSLNDYSINIINNIDSTMKIFVKKDLIAEWRKPKYILKIDESQIDPNKKLYLEMIIEFWTVFDNDTDKL